MRRCLTLLAVLLLAVPGCYGKRLASLEVRTARIEDQVNALERQHREMAALLQQVDRLLQEEVELARAGRAGNEDRLREIHRLLTVLATRVDESGEKYRELKDAVQFTRTPQDSAAGAVSPRALYDAAYQDLTRGNHGLAIMGFQEVLSKFPTSELADNAQYWIGESYYAQRDFKQAQQEFQKTVDTYPQGDKVPAALLKIALCQQQQGDKKAARATYERLVARFPHSEEARLASTKLQEL